MGIKSIEKELSEIREKGSPQISEEVCDNVKLLLNKMPNKLLKGLELDIRSNGSIDIWWNHTLCESLIKINVSKNKVTIDIDKVYYFAKKIIDWWEAFS